ncbi:MAG: mechanosensitive ion channel [Gemmatimonadetes bacterium]|uniref:Mechanosensitive ion channel n=1 Tax=Candidatus Kutchimonas denitrificans TaxID=3056748 RepID=A0AAE5CAX4_9BACT|nr:mechanosensitive ion channel [Gemmatimonadota bacterium]NIR73833.1 mechanosensitive ion channel [Candidatus Kutchimonas denitrificans]NIS02478.1 mechanosensitive ion channel [Gemmatimonadota bacterium]NIT68346.1 mechanosensitive ion channel [Gemmatimonadota bacterium]NIU51613.1 mechanosensitive ion channel [Gemmatimonadota bacterium]
MDLQGALQQASQLLVDLVSAWGLKLVAAIVLLVLGRLFAGWARRAARRALGRANFEPTLVPFIAGLIYWTLLAVVVVAVLGVVGVQTASFLAVFGAAGLAVGLAVQGTLSNFASGVMLLMFRPFGVGDYIDAGGTAGSVESIGMFATTLNTPDNVKITVPNSNVYGQTIKNYAANPTRRNDMSVGIGYDDDIGLAIETIQRVLKGDARVLAEPEPVIAVSELGDSSVNIVVRPWCTKEDYWSMRFDMMRKLKEELEAAGCSIPFPQRDVHLFQAG